MSLNLKQSLSQKQLQKLSPQQVQLMKLMQVTTMDMEQRIKEELQENPALEEGEGGIYGDEVSLSRIKEEPEERHVNDDDSASDSRTDEVGNGESGAEQPLEGSDSFDADFKVEDYVDRDRDDYAYKRKSENYRDPEEDYHVPIKFRQGLQEQLNNELGMLPLSETQRRIGEVIIGNIDEDGYLQRTVPAMVNDMAFTLNLMVDEKEVEEVLEMIRKLEPSGVGGSDLRECLLIQVRNKLSDAREHDASLGDLFVLQTAERLLASCFEEFARRQYGKIVEKLKVGEEDVREAIDLIKTLDPKPGQSGAESSSAAAPTLIPDFYLVNEDGQLVLSLNAKNDPHLRVSPSYEEMLEEYGTQQARDGKTGKGGLSKARQEKRRQTRDAALFVKQKIDSARWFMDMVRQRRNTMLRVMQAIVDFQHDFFLDGDVAFLKPMRLKDIAGKVDLDVSTISRVINNKFIQTHFGTFQVKRFFSQSLENEEGEEVSTTQIKVALQELVSAEDKTRPLTDEVLVDLLKSKGFVVARRTVAKYREGLGIPVARLRKTL